CVARGDELGRGVFGQSFDLAQAEAQGDLSFTRRRGDAERGARGSAGAQRGRDCGEAALILLPFAPVRRSARWNACGPLSGSAPLRAPITLPPCLRVSA